MRYQVRKTYYLFRRQVKRVLWPLVRGRFARTQIPLSWDEEELDQTGFFHLLSLYTCPIINPPSQHHVFVNKLHNLNLAVSRMQGLVLDPGEIFSFWRLVGDPCVASGYRDASTLIDNKIIMASGGGLCQLSGLLYNVALLAGCKILERHPHSVDVYGEGRYIPLGRDATVDYPDADLCFQNFYAFPLVLVLEVTPERASGALYAPKEQDLDVKIVVSPAQVIPSPVCRVMDTSLPAGQEQVRPGLEGKRVTAWRIIRSGSEDARRELLSNDTYVATPTIIRAGASFSGGDRCSKRPRPG